MVFILRHGETEGNREGRLQGTYDSPLTDLGMSQVVNNGKFLRDVTVSERNNVISSPLGRTKGTSIVIAKILGLKEKDIIFDDRIREMNFGIHEGLTKIERKKGKLSEQLQAYEKDKFNYRLEGGENYSDLEIRIRSFLEDFTLGESDIIIGHQSVNRIIMKILCEFTEEYSTKISHPNNVVYRYEGGALSYFQNEGHDPRWKNGTLQKK